MKNIIFGVLASVATLFAFSAIVHADYTNSIGMVFTDIPAGSFYMGSCGFTEADVRENKKRKFLGLTAKEANCPSGVEDVNGQRNELPQHKVHISKEFQMGILEVSVGQFKQFIVVAGRDDLLTSMFIARNKYGGDKAPVIGVSWDDAQAFIRWLNKKEAGNAYRLPTEAEWEYAARAGTTSYYWGNSPEDSLVPPDTPWWLFHMDGNVWEWVQDWYDKDYYANSPVNDPQGPSSGRGRVLRGGGWADYARDLRPAVRHSRSPSYRGGNSVSRYRDSPSSQGSYLGFRLVRQP